MDGAATTVARTWERRSGRIGGFHVAIREPSRGSRGSAIAMTGDGTGDGRATDGHDGCGGRRGGAGAPDRRGGERRAACTHRAHGRLMDKIVFDSPENSRRIKVPVPNTWNYFAYQTSNRDYRIQIFSYLPSRSFAIVFFRYQNKG